MTRPVAGCRTGPAEASWIFWRRMSWLERGIGRELVEREVEQPAVQRAFFFVIFFFGTVGVTAERKGFAGKNPNTRRGTLTRRSGILCLNTHAQCLGQPAFAPNRVSRYVHSSANHRHSYLSIRELGTINPTGEVPLWLTLCVCPLLRIYR